MFSLWQRNSNTTHKVFFSGLQTIGLVFCWPIFSTAWLFIEMFIWQPCVWRNGDVSAAMPTVVQLLLFWKVHDRSRQQRTMLLFHLVRLVLTLRLRRCIRSLVVSCLGCCRSLRVYWSVRTIKKFFSGMLFKHFRWALLISDVIWGIFWYNPDV